MKLASLGYETGSSDSIPLEELDHRVKNHQKHLNELAARHGLLDRQQFAMVNVGLHGGRDEARTIRVTDGELRVFDGPFAETREILGGFDLAEFDSIAEADEFERAHFTHQSHVGELRPITDMWWIMQVAGKKNLERFVFSLFVDEEAWLELTDGERSRLDAHQGNLALAYTQNALAPDDNGRQPPVCMMFARLAPSAEATTYRMRGEQIVTSPGPFGETPTELTGFVMIDCASMEHAVEWGRQLILHPAQSVEIRPTNGSWFVYHG